MAHTETNRHIAESVENMRGEQGLTQSALAREAGIPLTTFRRKIAGHGSFTLDELEALGLPLGRGLASWFADLPKIAGRA